MMVNPAMVAQRFRAPVSNSSRDSLEDPGMNLTWGEKAW